jgi:predicted DNA-binding transcriptional regulator YafY
VYSPLTRLLTILHMLNIHPTLTGDQIATELEVDKRTVRRYITMLRDLGIPVEAQAGNEGGYNLPPHYPLPPSIFTREEMEIMLQALDAKDDPAAVSARHKIKRLLQPFES